MADKKISQLTAKGSKIASTDRVPIAQDNGGGTFATKYVTGAEINEVKLDTTPQLGGDLDVNGFKLSSANDQDVIINPNGTGIAKIESDLHLRDTAGSTAKQINLYEGFSNGSNYIGIKAPDSLSTDTTYTLPTADGTSGQVLSTNGTGTLSWTTAGGGITVGTTAVTSGTDGRVFFQAGGVVQQSANLFWNNTNNRLGIGTSTPTQTLDVSGNSRFQYGTIESGINITGNSGSTTAAIVIGTGTLGTSGALEIWRNGAFALQFFSNIASLGNAYTRLKQGAGLTVTGSGGGSTAANSLTLGSNATDAGVFTATSGTQNTVNIGTSSNDVWSPSSGTATYNLLRINPRINTSGSYNGIVRGVLIDPTLTSTTGVTYRAIETTTGDVIFGSTSGNVAIGGTSFGSSSDKVFAQYSGIAPGSSPADAFQMYSADVVAGNAAPHIRTENGNIVKIYQETTAVAAATLVSNAGTNITDTDTFDGYTLKQIVKALRNLGILA